MSREVILVTGGAGFIGSNIVADLCLDAELDVVVCDRLRGSETGKWRNLSKHAVADFIAPDQLWPWLEANGRHVSFVIHMGAISSTLEPDADKIIQTNFGFSRDLFAWCARQQCRFIYASSAATYGAGEAGFEDAQDVASLAALRPLNAYGWSKALFDVFAARQAARGSAPPQWIGLKFFNVYGPNEAHKGAMRSVVAKIWPDVEASRAVKLFRSYNDQYGDGGQLRDFIHVRDLVSVVRWLRAEPTISGVFNLGTGRARSFRDLARAVFAAAGREPQIEFIEMPRELRDRYQYFTQARMERLRVAGYRAEFTSLEDGVVDYVTGYLSARDPYR